MRTKEQIAAVTLLIALGLAFPLVWLRAFLGPFPLFGEVAGVDFPVFALLALGVVVWKFPVLRDLAEKERLFRVLLIACAVGGAIVLLQQFSFGWNWRNFFTGLFFFTVPLAGVALGRELKRYLPCFLMILFLAGMAATIQDLTRGLPPLGISGNWNWNWTLLLISVPAFAFLFPRRKRIFFLLPAILLIAAGPMLLVREYASRAALLAAIGAAGLLEQVYLSRRSRAFGLSLLLFMFLLIAGIAVYFTVRTGTLSELIPGEIRTQLWEGAVGLAEDNPVSGVGAGRLVGVYTSYLPAEYFDSLHAANIHSHPHNEFLFYFCSFGIWGVVYLLILLACLFRSSIISPWDRNGTRLLCGWVFCVLLIHGQFDVILNTPLAGGLFLLLAGVLLSHGVSRRQEDMNRYRELGLALCWGVALLLFCLNLTSGLYCRSGKLALLAGDPEKGYRDLAKSVEYLPTVKNLYALGSVELFNFQAPGQAASTFRRIEEELKLPAYLHSAGLIARSLAAAGFLEESLPYFEKEQENFPRSAVNLALHSSVLRQLGRPEAEEIERQWLELMARKGFRPDEFRFLLQDQELDDSPNHRRIFFEERRR